MLQPKSKGGDFKWGDKKAVGRTDKNVSFYDSFTFQEVEYRLFDSAYFQIHGQCETSIGKLIRMYETAAGEKKVKVLWFFRPIDICNYLGKYVPQWNELFLACGDGPGVYSINLVDTIMRKCSVVYLSDDPIPPSPARRKLRNAGYVFSRAFDTKRKIILEDFPDAIAGVTVVNFFNKERDKDAPASSKPSSVNSSRSEKDLAAHVKKNPPGLKTKTKAKPILIMKDLAGLKTKTRASSLASGSSLDPKPSKRRKLVLNTSDSDDFPEPEERDLTKNRPLLDKAPSQKIGRCRWYKKLTFDEELKQATKEHRSVLIENLEPSFTSLEVEDLCKKAFKETVDAKMIPAMNCISQLGKALVIFETKEAADNAISRLTIETLMLYDRWPLVGSRYEVPIPKEVEKCRRLFTGHFSLVSRARTLKPTENRKVVSTSHCTQPNQILSDMAMQWKALRAETELRWKKLSEVQAKDINDIFRSKNP